MWTDKTLQEVAAEYAKANRFETIGFYGKNISSNQKDLERAFLAGCQYILDNTQE